MRDAIVRLAELAAELTANRPPLDKAAQAIRWADIRDISSDLAAQASVELGKTGIKAINVPWEDGDEEIAPLPYSWASTPAEVQAWAADAGIELELGGKVTLTCRFDGKPEDAVRAGLKQAGFRYNKPGRRWEHKAFGQYQNSDKVLEARAA